MNEPVLNFVEVENPDAVLPDGEKPGGKITMPKTDIPGIGLTAMILDLLRKRYRTLEAGTEAGR